MRLPRDSKGMRGLNQYWTRIHRRMGNNSIVARSASGQICPNEKHQLLAEAKGMSRSLYRNCLRSIQAIRNGNDHDRDEFKKRELERDAKLDNPSGDIRLSMISILPAGDWGDEMRSRYEYYQQYLRENWSQESDCLELDGPNGERNLMRFLHLLRKGEDQRLWLLADMRFQDPVRVNAFDRERMERFEARALAVLGPAAGPTSQDEKVTGDENDDGWSTDEDQDDGPTLPSWYRNPSGI